MKYCFDYKKLLSDGILIGFWPYRQAIVTPSIAMIEADNSNDAARIYDAIASCLGSWTTAPARQNREFIKRWNLENPKYRVRMDDRICFLMQFSFGRLFFMYSDNRLYVGDKITVMNW